jgi:hypothetical protein
VNFLRLVKRNGQLTLLAQGVSLLAVLLVGVLGYLSVNPQAHEFFHHGAGQGDHECVVTAFAAGEGLYVAPQVVPRPDRLVVERVAVIAREISRQSPDDRLPPACGPPAHTVHT